MTGKKGHSLRETCCHEHYPTSYDVYKIVNVSFIYIFFNLYYYI